MTPKGLMLFLGVVFVALVETSWGQKASSWRVYKATEGLPDSASIAVTISPQGKVLARYLNPASVGELDGYGVQTIPLAEESNWRVYGSPGGQLWTVGKEGLLEFKDGSWVLHRVPEIAAEFQAGRLRPFEAVPVCRVMPIKQGLVAVLLPDRLMEYNCEDLDHPRTVLLRITGRTQLGTFASLAPARDGGLWISGAAGLAKVGGPLRGLKPESEWREYLLPVTLEVQNLQEPHEDEEGNITVVAESQKTQQRVVLHLIGQQWTVENFGGEKIRQAWRGADNTGWAITVRSLLEWEAGRGQMSENEEIAARQYFDVAVEPGGAFWLATSDGLFRYAPLTWRSPGFARGIDFLVHGLREDAENRLWFVAGNALHLVRNGEHLQYPLPPDASGRSLQVRALFTLKGGALLLVTEPGREREGAGDQLVRFRPAGGEFKTVLSGDPAAALKVLGLLRDGSLCVQSKLGGAESSYRLEKFDGERFEPLLEPEPDPALGINLDAVFAAQNGDLWVSSDRGTACYHEKKWRAFAAGDRTMPEAVQRFTELADGKIWCATRNQVWEFDGKNWSLRRRGFDRINTLVRTRDGSVWVAANTGLYRFFQDVWIRNGVEEGLPGADVRAVVEDQRGRIWVGTAHGLSLYHPEADPDPPETIIQKSSGQEGQVPEGGTITLTFSGRDKWNFTPRERLLFSYRLDEHDWSPFEAVNGISFSDLPAGKHYFQVRAMDRNWNLGAPDRFEFEVILPWYKETRLVLISLGGLAAALFFAGLAFNRHRRLVRSYAEVERKVTERTRELEIANRELLHSQKMTALGTLAAGIAHDFNNILSIIKGSAQIIEDNLDNPEKVTTRVERIKTVVEQGAGIVRAMLGFSRDSGQQPISCDINPVVEDTIRLLGDRFQREVEVSFEPAPNLAPVAASNDLIQQALLNFIFNAAESMAEQKQIEVATHAVERLPASLTLTPAKPGPYVSVSVKDSGCGIPPENLPRIFEPFFTTKAMSVRRGTGLGLSMVYELAKKMGAGLAVESVVGQGSTFTLILPTGQTDSKSEDHRPEHQGDSKSEIRMESK